MQLSDLTDYAREKYGIEEQFKWADFPGFSVLCHPQTGKWAALLMRQWDTDTGTMIERCDVKCGSGVLMQYRKPFLSRPLRMHGSSWVGIAFDDSTESSIVYCLFDQAVSEGNGYTLILDVPAVKTGTGSPVYHDTALPFAGHTPPVQPVKESPPERLRQMRHLYQYGRESAASRAENFYRQAVFMQDYEDDVPWTGDFLCYFPTYQDLTTRQLRGYFTWRTKLRRGDWQPVSASAAYLYLYELLNGIGAASPEDALRQMDAFEHGFLDAGFGNAAMRSNLRRWKLEYAVLKALPAAAALQAADPEMIRSDTALAVLRAPEAHSDEELCDALSCFGGKRLTGSAMLTAGDGSAGRLFGAVWRRAAAYRRDGKDLFTLCFGRQETRHWYPLSNAVYYDPEGPADTDYVLDGCRTYHCRNGIWTIDAYEKLSFNRALFQGVLRAADARLRRALKTGRYLKDDPAFAWVLPFVDAVIAEERKAQIEAARPKITIDLSGLDRIRQDAAMTRDSLLTAEEMPEAEKLPEAEGPDETVPLPGGAGLLPDPIEEKILRALLAGRDAAPILQAHHRMPSLTADSINEYFLEEIGDTVLLCEDDRLFLVDDYIEELKQYLGGTTNG